MMKPSTLIVPVESRVRELDAKVLLAAVAAERGFPVVLGSRQELNFAIPQIPRGLFFAKSMRFTSDRMTRLIRGFGHHLIATDEESLVRFSSPEYYAWRFSPRSFEPLRHLFAWGEDDAAMFHDYPGRSASTAVHITGNPRVDLLRQEVRGVFEGDAEALRSQHGPFILINTNFPFVNAFVKELALIQRHGSKTWVGRTGRGMSLDFALGMERHHRALFDAFSSLVPALSRTFPDRAVILRPHPSEDHDQWRRLAAGFRNVHVLHEGNVVPWLMAARVLIHNGCTTAVEGALLGTPAVAYRPVQAECYDYHLPNSLSVQTFSQEATLDAVADILSGRSDGIGGEERSRILARHVDLEPDALAAERIVDVLTRDGYLEGPPPPAPPSARAWSWLETNGRTAVKRINRLRPNHRNGKAYLRHRFPPLTTTEVNGRLRALESRLHRFEGIAARPAGPDLFTIERVGLRSASA